VLAQRCAAFALGAEWKPLNCKLSVFCLYIVKVVLTDYPDKALLDNLSYNVDQNVQPETPCRPAQAQAQAAASSAVRVRVLGYVWGTFVDPLRGALLQDTETETETATGTGTEPDADADAAAAADPETSYFDLILLSDLIFNHSQVRFHHHLYVYVRFRTKPK
jgi:nicotinamide N-methyltransferase